MLLQVDELDQSNNELEDTNTRLEARAQQAESQVSQLQQELQEASAQVGLCHSSHVCSSCAMTDRPLMLLKPDA